MPTYEVELQLQPNRSSQTPPCLPTFNKTMSSLPLLTRIKYLLIVLAIKVVLQFLRLKSRLFPKPGTPKPTYAKYYPATGSLKHHVFIPSSYKPGDPALPLYIDIHGGGFIIGRPADDDAANSVLAHKYGICVVSLNYRKAPRHPFPAAVYDTAAGIAAVLDDPELPVDKSRVAVGGYSAGGNLALTATQLNGLSHRLKAAVACYPVTDPTRPLEKRQETAKQSPGRPGFPAAITMAFRWAYTSGSANSTDPLLAPLYAKKEDVPQKVYLLGCEYDQLLTEAEELANRLATEQVAGKTRVPLSDGRVGWTCGNIAWEQIQGVEHGFNLRPEETDEQVRKVWDQRTDELYANIAEWLFKEVYSGQ